MVSYYVRKTNQVFILLLSIIDCTVTVLYLKWGRHRIHAIQVLDNLREDEAGQVILARGDVAKACVDI